MAGLPLLEDHFRIGEPMGEGGFGIVHGGEALAGGRKVAIKRGRDAETPETRARVLREARLLAGVCHPRLVTLVGCFESRAGGLALVYELVEGRPLDEVLAGGPPDRPAALRWLGDVAGALDALHAAGLVHRDVKPSNVIVEPGGTARLIDFGLLRPSCKGQTLTATGILVGTPEYMAPEQLLGEPPRPPADVYALACVAYELLAGRRPFAGTGPDAIDRLARRSGSRDVPRVPEVPVAVDEVLRRALAAEPPARPASAGAFVDELKAAGQAPRHQGETRVLAPAAAVLLPHTPFPGRGPADGAGSRSPGRRFLPWWPMALVAAAVTLGVAWAPSPPLAPAVPTAAAEAEPFGPGFVDELLEEIDRLSEVRVDPRGGIVDTSSGAPRPGTRRLTDPDPALWGLLLDHTPSLQRFQEWLAAGGRAETLPASVLASLREVDGRFARRGLVRPFFPFAYAVPAADPEPVPESWKPFEELHAGVPLTGWAATAARACAQAEREARERTAELVGDMAEGRTPFGYSARGLATAAVGAEIDLELIARLVFIRSEGRTTAGAWMLPGHDLVTLLYYALVRAIEEQPGIASSLVLAFVQVRRALEGFCSGPRAFAPRVWTLGRPDGSPQAAHLEAMLIGMQVRVLRRSTTEPKRFAELPWLQLQLLERAQEPGAAGPADRRRIAGARMSLFIELCVNADDVPAYRPRVRDFYLANREDLERDGPTEAQFHLCRLVSRTRDEMGFDRSLLEGVLRDLVLGSGSLSPGSRAALPEVELRMREVLGRDAVSGS